MRNARVMGIVFVIFGVLLIASSAVTEPIRWWRVGAGVLFALVGLAYFLRARAVTPPAA